MADPIFKELAYSALAQTAKNPTQDFLRATPRNPVLGYLADLTASSYAPQRTQQMQGIAQFLGVPAVSQTLDRLSYGEPLTTGAGGLGGTTRFRPEAIEAAMTVAPMGRPAATAAKRAALATKGRPVGMSTEAVGGMGFLRPGAETQEEAMRLAQQRAALPVEQGGLGLPADNTPMDRAKAMEFDYVRRSQRQKTPFNDVDYAMFVEANGDYDDALDVVSSYGKSQWLGRAEEDVTKYQKNIVKAIRRNDLQREYNSTAAALARDANPPDIVDSAGLWDAPDLAAASIEALNDLGVKGVKTQDGAVIWDPENIRSRFAAFDPFRKTAATAAAMGVAAPNLMAQEQPSISEAEQRARIMLDIGQDPYTIYQQTGVWLGGNE